MAGKPLDVYGAATSHAAAVATTLAPNQPPPIRATPTTPDSYDPARVKLVRDRWSGQDILLLDFARTVEENVRMLVGRQWDVWSDMLGRFVDVSQFLTDEEKRWRQRPVVNRLLYWFILTHAKLTENEPVVTFQPSSSDRKDAMLAEAMDTIFKTIYQEVGMVEAIDRMVAWMIPGGAAYIKTRVDFTKGPVVSQPGTSSQSAAPGDGQTTPDQSGTTSLGATPAATLPPDAQNPGGATGSAPAGNDPAVGQLGGNTVDPKGPSEEREGQFVVDVLGPLECRGQWGSNIPWHKKTWHIHRSYLTPEDVKSLYGVDVEPEVFEAVGASFGASGGYLERLLFGGGYYGAASNKPGAQTASRGSPTGGSRRDGFIAVDEMWEAPNVWSPETEDSPGGRLLIVTHNKVLHDSIRPAHFLHTSPIREFRFLTVPGRPSGSSPQEMLNPIQKSLNRGWAQMLEHRNLMTNPILEIDSASGLDESQISNRPGAMYFVNKRPGVDALTYRAPPPISGDFWRTQDQLSATLDMLGNTNGAPADAPQPGASGELIKELRFNSDRFIGSTARRNVHEIARWADDVLAYLPVVWTQEKILSYAGEDNVIRTVTVMPEMFKGKVNVVADTESMLPEGRGERQSRIAWMYQQALFGPPGDPNAITQYMSLARFPNLNRAMRPGGVNRVTAEQNLGRLVQGVPAEQIPVFEWYDFGIHLKATEDFMCSPEFLTLPPPVQQQFVMHREQIQGAQAAKMAADMQQATAQASMQAAAQGQVAHVSQATAPQPAVDPESPDAQKQAGAPDRGSAPAGPVIPK